MLVILQLTSAILKFRQYYFMPCLCLIYGSSAKYNDCQYFRLYGMYFFKLVTTSGIPVYKCYHSHECNIKCIHLHLRFHELLNMDMISGSLVPRPLFL